MDVARVFGEHKGGVRKQAMWVQVRTGSGDVAATRTLTCQEAMQFSEHRQGQNEKHGMVATDDEERSGKGEWDMNRNNTWRICGLSLLLLFAWTFAGLGLTVGPGGPPTYNYESIQEALDVATTGQTITVASGTYVEDGLYIDKSVTIVGAGETETIVRINRTSESYGIQTSTDSELEVTFKNMTFEAVENVRYFFFHIAHNKAFTLENVTVVGMGKDYYDSHGEGWGNTVGGVDLINLEYGTLTNVTVSETSRNAVSFSAVKNIVVENIDVFDSGARDGSAAVAIYLRDEYPDNNPEVIDIDGGTITGAPIGMNLHGGALGVVADDDIRNVDFTDNMVQAVASAGEAEALLAHNTFDRAVVVRGSPIKVPVIFSSIQDAIDAAEAGDIVEVSPGTYRVADESWDGRRCIFIDKNLTLRGAGSGQTILDAEHTHSVMNSANSSCGPHCTVIWNQAQEVTIEGITVTRGDWGIRNTTVDIGGGAQNSVTLIDVVVTHHHGFGIIFENDVSSLTITDCEASQNGYFGIYLSPNCHAGTVTVTNTNASHNGRIGFSCQGSITDLTMTGGTFSYNTGGDVWANCNAQEGPFYGFGIELRNCRGTLTDVTATHNGFGGPTIVGGKYGAEGGAGIVVKDGQTHPNDVSIVGATLVDNMNGLWIEDPDAVENWEADFDGVVSINGSIIAGNQEFGVLNCTNPTWVDATDNWWGSSTGPTHPDNPGGDGDKVSDFVDYSNWKWETAVVIATAPTNEGYIKPSGSVSVDEEGKWFKIEAQECFRIAHVLLDDEIEIGLDDDTEQYFWREDSTEKTAWLFFIPSEPHHTLQPIFEPIPYTIIIDKDGEGTIKLDGEAIALPYEEEHDKCTEIELEAFPADGWRFSHWTVASENPGTTQETDNPVIIPVNGPKTITAHFTQDEYELKVRTTPGGSVNVTINDSPAPPVLPDDEGIYGTNHGDEVCLEAKPEEGYRFVKWIGAPIDGETGLEGCFSVTGDHHITAEFEADKVLPRCWHMISVPRIPDNPDPTAVFDEVVQAHLGQIFLWEWRQGSSYVQHPAEPAIEIEPGRGYWLKLFYEVGIVVSGDFPDETYWIHLQNSGWHMVSTTGPSERPVSDIRFGLAEHPDGISFVEAVELGLVYNTIFGYDSELNEYFNAFVAGVDDPNTTMLDPWKGYWILTYAGNMLMWPRGAEVHDEPIWPIDPPFGLGGTSSVGIAWPGSTPPPPPTLELGASMLDVVAYPNPLQQDGAVMFRATGLPAEAIRVTVFDVSGAQVFRAEGHGNVLSWDAMGPTGRPVANGVYLYRVQIKANGQWFTAPAARLLILR